MELTREEHQELVLLLGSRKEWATFLGLDPKQATSTWTKLGLLTPTHYVRKLATSQLTEIVAAKRGIKQAADHLGVSESFLILNLRERHGYVKPDVPDWSQATCRQLFERYRSVRFVARMSNLTEAQVRRAVEAAGLEVAALIDYSTGDHSNAKGRRAELDFAALRGDEIVEDLNLTLGSQAEYDFQDRTLGKVNVKSACRSRYTAKTRADDPHYWKFSTKGWAKADCLVVMCYNEDMSELIGYRIVPIEALSGKKSETLQRDALTIPKREECPTS